MTERAKKGSLKGLVCAVDGCAESMYSRLMCKRHYKQLHRTGTAKPGVKGMHGSPEERFWTYVDAAAADECWLWNGHRNKNGYGTLRSKTTTLAVHRVSYEMHKGKIPEGLVIRHMCNNPPCVNPNHLLVGTNLDNVMDKVRAGRTPVNESHGNCKYSNEVVAQIRAATGRRKDIAKAFGVSESQVGNIRSGAQRPPETIEKEV